MVFAREDLNVTDYESYVTGMALALALARGDIDAAYICLIPAVNAYANGGVPIKVVAGIHRYGYGLVVNPDKVRTVSDLTKENIRIGCTREGSPSDVLLQKMIEKYHLDGLSKKVLRMNPAEQFLALNAGKIDAGFMCEQYPSMAVENGFKILLNAEDLWADMPGSVLVVREELIEKYPETVRRLVKVTKKATDFINRNPEEASMIVAEKLRVAAGKLFPIKMVNTVSKVQITESSLLNSMTRGMVNTVDLDINEVQKTIDACWELGYIKKRFKAEDFVNLRFLK